MAQTSSNEVSDTTPIDNNGSRIRLAVKKVKECFLCSFVANTRTVHWKRNSTFCLGETRGILELALESSILEGAGDYRPEHSLGGPLHPAMSMACESPSGMSLSSTYTTLTPLQHLPPLSTVSDKAGSSGQVEEINTKEVAQRITAELKRYSIPQAIFAQRILCRSQGTLSDLLRNPKPWSKLKSGRETFRRMWKWLQEPEFQRMSALRLAAPRAMSQGTPVAPELCSDSGSFHPAAELLIEIRSGKKEPGSSGMASLGLFFTS
ncbi:One cut domain family member 2 [Chelonia mydas]|uniref:One cut domain family member 2 n=1 Tax=Chelonia mydas TaxID=8469 RepID=M7AQI1_CHEMY|nr:One cut domain family member 2 [Chelonia mydas]